MTFALAEESSLATPKICTHYEDLEYTFTDCNEDLDTTTVLFYYDVDKYCDMRHGKSDPIPKFFYGMPCKHLCPDG